MNCSNGKLRWMFEFAFFCVIMSLGWASSASESYSFEIHHRFSEQVKAVLGGHDLPEMGTLDYHKALVHHDRRRRLTSNNRHPTVSFAQGNSTQQFSYLHYANVTVGTPAQWFLVALDTGSDYFWLPCNCNSTCIRNMKGISLNIYNPNISTSSSKVTCKSKLCSLRNTCLSPLSDCPYRIEYTSPPGSMSTGVLVEDVIHMRTEEGEARDARITFGCSESQLEGLQNDTVNGMMGLAIADIAVPNMLAKAKVASNSFSMCFDPKGKGTISFGDKGSSDQLETPLNGKHSLFYDVSITKFKVGNETLETEFRAIFDSGTAVTHLLEPFYSSITKIFHLSVTETRLPESVHIPFEFCYIITSTTDVDKLPRISFEMKGGAAYDVFSPILVFNTSNDKVYCLAVMKQVDADTSIIGQNFMTNRRIVYDRERMILGWKESNCTDANGFTNPSTRLNPLAAFSVFIIFFFSFVCT